MRYIRIPQPVRLEGLKGNDGNLLAPFIYSFGEFLLEHCWTKKEWRAAGWTEVMLRLVDKFAGRLPGDVVALTDEDFEKFAPIAAMRGVDLNPLLAIPFSRLILAVNTATSDPIEAMTRPEAMGASTGAKLELRPGTGTTAAGTEAEKPS